MDNNTTTKVKNDGTIEIKQSFLSSAISDISAYIQLTDTKVSIIMASVIAIIAGAFSCHDLFTASIDQIKPCSWLGITLIIFIAILTVSLIGIFVFGILTIRSHSSKIGYNSKWFIPRSCSEYSFDAFNKDVLAMTDEDIIENMSAELYKLNDINRQKSKSYKWTLACFSASLIAAFTICAFLALSNL